MTPFLVKMDIRQGRVAAVFGPSLGLPRPSTAGFWPFGTPIWPSTTQNCFVRCPTAKPAPNQLAFASEMASSSSSPIITQLPQPEIGVGIAPEPPRIDRQPGSFVRPVRFRSLRSPGCPRESCERKRNGHQRGSRSASSPPPCQSGGRQADQCQRARLGEWARKRCRSSLHLRGFAPAPMCTAIPAAPRSGTGSCRIACPPSALPNPSALYTSPHT